MNDLLSSFFEVFYNKKLSLSVCQFTWHLVIRQSIKCSILRTLPSLSNQCNAFRLDIYALQLKGDHLVEGAMLYQRDALRLTFNRYFTRRSKLRVNTQSHRRAIKLFYATTYHDFVYIFVKYRYKIPNTKLYVWFWWKYPYSKSNFHFQVTYWNSKNTCNII